MRRMRQTYFDDDLHVFELNKMFLSFKFWELYQNVFCFLKLLKQKMQQLFYNLSFLLQLMLHPVIQSNLIWNITKSEIRSDLDNYPWDFVTSIKTEDISFYSFCNRYLLIYNSFHIKKCNSILTYAFLYFLHA